MLGLCVNNCVDAVDEEEFKLHRVKASTMDLNDLSIERAGASIAIEASTQRAESDDDAPNCELLVLAPKRPPLEP